MNATVKHDIQPPINDDRQRALWQYEKKRNIEQLRDRTIRIGRIE